LNELTFKTENDLITLLQTYEQLIKNQRPDILHRIRHHLANAQRRNLANNDEYHMAIQDNHKTAEEIAKAQKFINSLPNTSQVIPIKE
jgi:hypothetical protein